MKLKHLLLIAMIGLVSACDKNNDNSESGGNIALCRENQDQEFPKIIQDGSGNAIVVWSDYKIYAQKMDFNLNKLWGKSGVITNSPDEMQKRPTICPDGSGGVFIAWEDKRNGNPDIYVQRINSSGERLFTESGTDVLIADGNQYSPEIIPDGNGGAILAWQTGEIDSNTSDIFVQKINQDGIVQWNSQGVQITKVVNNQFSVKLVSDGQGGAILTWIDKRNSDPDIYAQRIGSNGDIMWKENGVAICSLTGEQWYPDILSDGQGGAVIAWNNFNWGTMNLSDIYAQRINSEGLVQWTENGVAIVNADRAQEKQKMISDGMGNILIVWSDYRNGSDNNIYAQKISMDGTPLWIVNGIVVCDDIDSQSSPDLVSDGSGGAYITWDVYRNYYDIYAQRINSDGELMWEKNGVVISAVDETQWDQHITAVNNHGGAIIVWTDYRNDYTVSGLDVYADYISADGTKK